MLRLWVLKVTPRTDSSAPLHQKTTAPSLPLAWGQALHPDPEGELQYCCLVPGK